MKEVYFYEFCSDRQYIFSVEVGGVRRLIEFGDQNQFGRSVYQTKNRQIAEAIRKTSMYKSGDICSKARRRRESPIPSKEQDRGKDLCEHHTGERMGEQVLWHRQEQAPTSCTDDRSSSGARDKDRDNKRIAAK